MNFILFGLVLIIAALIYRGYVMRKARAAGDMSYLVPWGLAAIGALAFLFLVA